MEPRVFWSRIDWAARALLAAILFGGTAFVWRYLSHNAIDSGFHRELGLTLVSFVVLNVIGFGSIAVGIIFWSHEQKQNGAPVPKLFTLPKYSVKVQRIVAASFVASVALALIPNGSRGHWSVSADLLVAPFSLMLGMVGKVFGFTWLLLAFAATLTLVGLEQVLLYGSLIPELARH